MSLIQNHSLQYEERMKTGSWMDKRLGFLKYVHAQGLHLREGKRTKKSQGRDFSGVAEQAGKDNKYGVRNKSNSGLNYILCAVISNSSSFNTKLSNEFKLFSAEVRLMYILIAYRFYNFNRSKLDPSSLPLKHTSNIFTACLVKFSHLIQKN